MKQNIDPILIFKLFLGIFILIFLDFDGSKVLITSLRVIPTVTSY